jgi:hypothetical protein
VVIVPVMMVAMTLMGMAVVMMPVLVVVVHG